LRSETNRRNGRATSSEPSPGFRTAPEPANSALSTEYQGFPQRAGMRGGPRSIRLELCEGLSELLYRAAPRRSGDVRAVSR
jgi:hypothetical protein